eukprot:1447125-Pyramimonas_sp.AAC.1
MRTRRPQGPSVPGTPGAPDAPRASACARCAAYSSRARRATFGARAECVRCACARDITYIGKHVGPHHPCRKPIAIM